MKRIICLIISLSLIMSFASCVKSAEKEENSERELSLKIESVDAVYSDKLIKDASLSLSDAAEVIIYKKEKLKLSAEEKEKLQIYIEDTVLSVLREIPVYENELRKLCDYALYVAEHYETEDAFSVYSELVSLLGNERNASLYYELITLYLTHTRDDYKTKYEQTGYPWHLAELEKCNALLNDLTSLLGKEKFISAFDFSVTCIALTSGVLLSENADASFKLNASELNMLIHRHSMLLSLKNLTDTEWAAAFRISEYVAQKKLTLSDPVRNAISSALLDSSFLEGVSVSTNDFIKLYEKLSLCLTDEQCESLMHGNKAETLRTLCTLLASCKEDFSAFLVALESASMPDVSIGLSELKAIGYGNAYSEFTNAQLSISSDEFIKAVCDFASSDSDSTAAFNNAVISYIYGISPCLAFLVSLELQENDETKGA